MAKSQGMPGQYTAGLLGIAGQAHLEAPPSTEPHSTSLQQKCDAVLLAGCK